MVLAGRVFELSLRGGKTYGSMIWETSRDRGGRGGVRISRGGRPMRNGKKGSVMCGVGIFGWCVSRLLADNDALWPLVTCSNLF